MKLKINKNFIKESRIKNRNQNNKDQIKIEIKRIRTKLKNNNI